MTESDVATHQVYWKAIDAPDPRLRPGSVDDDLVDRLLALAADAEIQDRRDLDPHAPSKGDEAPPRAACLWLLARTSDLTFEQALRAFRTQPRLSKFAGRVLTHPDADVETWLEIARTSPSRNIRFAIASIPEAMRDQHVREALLDNLIEETGSEYRPLIYRVLSFASSDELRRQFKKIVKLNDDFAIELLKKDEFRVRARLQVDNIAPLLTHKDREVRTELILLLGEVEGEDWTPELAEDLPLPEREFEAGRVRRANDLPARHLEGDQYVVASKGYEYFVTVGGRTLCYCTDEVFNSDVYCKHVTAAMREARDERFLRRQAGRRP